VVESVYKVIELVGTSTQSWELAAKTAVERAAKTLRDLRVAEVVEQDLVIEDGKVEVRNSSSQIITPTGRGGAVLDCPPRHPQDLPIRLATRQG
jgi:dodecin